MTVEEDIAKTMQHKMFMTAQGLKKLCEKHSMSWSELMFALLEEIKLKAVMPLADFYVGAIAVGKSGRYYFGASQDFVGTATNQCIHAEQSAICNAFIHHEASVKQVIVNKAPCGYCRQFIREMANGLDIAIMFPEHEGCTLGELLPFSFGPADLNHEGGLLTPQSHNLSLCETNDDLIYQKALSAANRSYSPYFHSYAGVALELKDGKIIDGSYLENVAQNPGLGAMQAALIHLNLSGYTYDAILRGVLVEYKSAPIKQADAALSLLKAVNSKANFATCYAI